MARERNGLSRFDRNGNLPAGVHRASMEEIEERLVWNGKRRSLFKGLERASRSLASAGVRQLLIGGSFVTSKEEPNDIDGCWEYDESVDDEKLDEVFLDLHPPREAMKRKYGVDFLISGTPLINGGGQTVEEFFRFDRDGNRKGIVLIELSEES